MIGMKIKLQGIGIIKNSEIELNGLTVITGDNNSGKTTVGKVVYSLFDAVSDLQRKAESDKNTYAMRKLQNIIRDLFFLSVCFDRNTKDDPDLAALFLRHNIRTSNALTIARKLYAWLIEFRETGFDALDEEIQDSIFKYITTRYRSSQNKDIKPGELMGFLLDMSLESLTKLFEDIDSDPELINYAKENISETLNVEFSGQIQPVIFDVEKSSIVIEDDDKVCFHLNFIDNKIVANADEPVYFDSSLVNRAFFVDNPFILDSEEMMSNSFDFDDEHYTVLNKRRIRRHEIKLRRFLKRQTDNVFESTVLEKRNSNINNKINEVISGEFEFNVDGDYYISKGRKLRFSNLATGSKLFSILKLLINKGALDESTLLVLDEPEAHLHPAWQNKFAEIIVMLVKELNVKILLTSHSPNFVLAIDAFMRKYEINNKTNFYHTHLMEDGFAEYINVNDDMGLIYSDFVQYLTEVKILRNKFMYGLGENDD